MQGPDPAEHLKVAKRLHFQGLTEEAIREYQLVLELDPDNYEAAEGLRAMGVEPPDPLARKAAYEGAAVKTNFFVNQAKETHKPGWSGAPLKVVLLVLLAAVGYGGYVGISMLMDFDNIKAAESVDAAIDKMKAKEDGTMVAEVKVSNFNPGPVKNIVLSFDLCDAKGEPIKHSKLKIENTVPAGDKRTFVGVELGKFDSKPSKVSGQKLEHVSYAKPKKLSERVAYKFITAAQKPDKETFSDFDEITNDADSFAPALVGMGRAYAGRGDWKRAIEQYKKALDSDPDNANAHYYLSVALYYANQKDEAKKEIAQAVNLQPDDPTYVAGQKMLDEAK